MKQFTVFISFTLLSFLFVQEVKSQVVVTKRIVVAHSPLVYPYRGVRPSVIVQKPITKLVVVTTPKIYKLIYVAGKPYYYWQGIYYVKNEKSDNYTVVTSPIGAVIMELPEGAKQLILDNKVYYQYNNTIYKETIIENKIAYEVVSYSN